MWYSINTSTQRTEVAKRRVRAAILLLGLAVGLFWATGAGHAQEAGPLTAAEGPTITGVIVDSQGRPVAGATVALVLEDHADALAETESQPSGAFILYVPEEALATDRLSVLIERPHFTSVLYQLSSDDVQALVTNHTLTLSTTMLKRRITAAFWIATLAFAGMLALIALEVLHNTLAALVGVAIVFLTSYLGGAVSDDLFIFNFERAMVYIDWEVIFLVMGMMIVIAVVEGTGIFQWLAYFAYRVSRGKSWLLVAILMLITALASAFLDNVTTMLLMTPITIQIALSLEMNPLPLLMPEVMASNVGGIATLIGTPTNILIGSFAGISFTSFIVNLTPGVLMAMVALIIYVEVVYFRAYREAAAVTSPGLERLLRERSQITAPDDLRKAGWVGLGMLILFLLGERIHLVPAVTALLGATALLVWIRPDVEHMIEAVDWTTLVFFMGLFVMVGAIQEVGLIAWIADLVAHIVGTNLTLAMILIIWMSAFMSMMVDNIPFAAAMLPVVGFLTSQIPGAENRMLFFALSVGAAMGGNGTLIGSSPNLVAAGIAERAGYPITYGTFLKYGLPATIVTVAVGTLWLLIRF
ncbi:MAG: citrate transporter [Chloroflexi bacterium]|nr:MAG: citrate transporter [Chloroflexota bacterium]